MPYIIDEENKIARLGEAGTEAVLINLDSGLGHVRCFHGDLLAASEAAAGDESARLEHPGGVPDDTDDFMHRVFRVLSCTLIPGYWLDLTDEKMMRKATKLFVATLYKNHGRWHGYDVDEWIGQMMRPAFTQSKGIPGIDAVYRFDRTRPEAQSVIRGLSVEPPAITATSAAFTFRATRSHNDLENYEFFRNMGREIDGEIVRWVVTEITRVLEGSIVYAGADENATALSVSLLNSPAGAGKPAPDSDSNQQEQVMEKEEEEKLKAELAEKDAKIESQSQELATLRETLGDYDLDTVKAAVQFQNDRLQEARSAARKSYLATLSPGRKENAAILSMIDNANFEQAAAFQAEYHATLDAKHAPKCGDCGSANISRLSSSPASLPDPDKADRTQAKAAAKPVSGFKVGKRR